MPNLRPTRHFSERPTSSSLNIRNYCSPGLEMLPRSNPLLHRFHSASSGDVGEPVAESCVRRGEISASQVNVTAAFSQVNNYHLEIQRS